MNIILSTCNSERLTRVTQWAIVVPLPTDCAGAASAHSFSGTQARATGYPLAPIVALVLEGAGEGSLS